MEESQQCNEKKKKKKKGKERSPCSCLSIIVTDPVFIHEKTYFPQRCLEERKYKYKKKILATFIKDDIERSSSDNDNNCSIKEDPEEDV